MGQFDTVDCTSPGCPNEAEPGEDLCATCARRRRPKPARATKPRTKSPPASIQYELHQAIQLLERARGPYLKARATYVEALAHYQRCRDHYDRATRTGTDLIDHPDGLARLMKQLPTPPQDP